MFTILEDTSGGVHDTLIAACDKERYLELGCKEEEGHRNCADNLVEALVAIGKWPTFPSYSIYYLMKKYS